LTPRKLTVKWKIYMKSRAFQRFGTKNVAIFTWLSNRHVENIHRWYLQHEPCE